MTFQDKNKNKNKIKLQIFFLKEKLKNNISEEQAKEIKSKLKELKYKLKILSS